MSVGKAGAVTVKINVGGDDVPEDHQVSFTVDRDMNQPDMASIVLYNQDHRYSKLKLADPVEIKIGDDQASIYQGEIVGLEPVYRGGEPQRISIRAMNKMHKLLRKRTSRTFADKTDQQILTQVAQDAGLTLDWKHEKSITYKHVYQHNQSNMEFLRTRAARMGCHVWCVGTKLNVKQPDLANDSGVELKISQKVGDGEQLRSFSPRVSSAPIHKKITVKGWNPETKELIQGEYAAQASPLGSQNAVTASGEHGEEESFNVDQPIWSKEEAVALAKAKLVDESLGYMTGEAEAVGDPKFEIGTVVKLTINTEAADDTFNGKYYVMGLSHRYIAGGKDKDGGFVSHLRLARDAQKGA
ncbi:MAG: contractile injection system protein, VgrG/Pvc8 family [Kofleriaceae bacterium]